MKPLTLTGPERAAERGHDPEGMQASTGRLIEALTETRRERDAARREADQHRRRADALLRHLERLRALLDRPRLRSRPVPAGQLPLPLGNGR